MSTTSTENSLEIKEGESIDFGSKFEEILEPDNNHREGYSSNVISPSSIGYCDRQAFISNHSRMQPVFNDKAKASMFLGSAIHEALQKKDHYDDTVMQEFEVFGRGMYRDETGTTVIRGNADAIDENGIVYDFKTTSSLKYAPKQRHIDQVQVYLNLLDAPKGVIVYIRNWIDDDGFEVKQKKVEKDIAEFEDLVDKAHRIRHAIESFDDGEKIPFDKCGCFFCENEEIQRRDQ